MSERNRTGTTTENNFDKLVVKAQEVKKLSVKCTEVLAAKKQAYAECRQVT